MIFGETTASKRKRKREWTEWFAWRPVHLRDGRWAWLETVLWRKYYHFYGSENQYEPIEE